MVGEDHTPHCVASVSSALIHCAAIILAASAPGSPAPRELVSNPALPATQKAPQPTAASPHPARLATGTCHPQAAWRTSIRRCHPNRSASPDRPVSPGIHRRRPRTDQPASVRGPVPPNPRLPCGSQQASSLPALEPRSSDRSRASLQGAKYCRHRLRFGPAADPERHAFDLDLDASGGPLPFGVFAGVAVLREAVWESPIPQQPAQTAAPCCPGSARACRRQVNTCCGVSPCWRAISETTASRASVSSTTLALKSAENRRRRPVPVITSSRRTSVTSGSSLWSSIDTSRSPIQRSAQSPITGLKKRWDQNSAYFPTCGLALFRRKYLATTSKVAHWSNPERRAQ